MNQNNDWRSDALQMIERAQYDCAKITVQIGGVSESGMVQHGSLYIRDAPSCVVDELINEGFTLRPSEDGLQVLGYARDRRKSEGR